MASNSSTSTYNRTYNLIGMGLGPLLVGVLSDTMAPSYGVDSIRYALLIVGLVHVICSVLNLLSARHLEADLAVARETAPSPATPAPVR